MIRGQWKYDPKARRFVETTDPPKAAPEAPAFHRDEWLDGISCRCCRIPRVFYSRCKYNEHVKAMGFEVTGEVDMRPTPQRSREQRINEIAEDVRRAHFGARYDELRVDDAERQSWKHQKRVQERYLRGRARRARPIRYGDL